MIRFENVYKEYIDSDIQFKKSFKEKLFTKKAKKTVIQDLNLEINEGEIVGYIGEKCWKIYDNKDVVRNYPCRFW